MANPHGRDTNKIIGSVGDRSTQSQSVGAGDTDKFSNFTPFPSHVPMLGNIQQNMANISFQYNTTMPIPPSADGNSGGFVPVDTMALYNMCASTVEYCNQLNMDMDGTPYMFVPGNTITVVRNPNSSIAPANCNNQFSDFNLVDHDTMRNQQVATVNGPPIQITPTSEYPTIEESNKNAFYPTDRNKPSEDQIIQDELDLMDSNSILLHNHDTSLSGTVGTRKESSSLVGQEGSNMSPSIQFPFYTNFAQSGSETAEKIATTHCYKECFKKLDTICSRLRHDLLQESAIMSNINSQGIPWAIKDFILAFTRIMNSWNCLKGYIYNNDEGLNAIKSCFPPTMIDNFYKWEDSTFAFASDLIETFKNLDILSQSQNKSYSTNEDNLVNDSHSSANSNNNPKNISPRICSNDSNDSTYNPLNKESKTKDGNPSREEETLPINFKSNNASPWATNVPKKTGKLKISLKILNEAAGQKSPLVDWKNSPRGDQPPNFSNSMSSCTEDNTESTTQNSNDFAPQSSSFLNFNFKPNLILTGKQNDDVDCSATVTEDSINVININLDSQKIENLSNFEESQTEAFSGYLNDHTNQFKLFLKLCYQNYEANPERFFSDRTSTGNSKCVALCEGVLQLKYLDYFFHTSCLSILFPQFFLEQSKNFLDLSSIIQKVIDGGSYIHFYHLLNNIKRIIFVVKEYLKKTPDGFLRTAVDLFEGELNESLVKSPFVEDSLLKVTGSPYEELLFYSFYKEKCEERSSPNNIETLDKDDKRNSGNNTSINTRNLGDKYRRVERKPPQSRFAHDLKELLDKAPIHLVKKTRNVSDGNRGSGRCRYCRPTQREREIPSKKKRLSNGQNPKVENKKFVNTAKQEQKTKVKQPQVKPAASSKFSNCSNPAASSKCSNPAASSKCSNPAASSKCSNPAASSKCSNPAASSKCSNPAASSKFSNPAASSKFSNPENGNGRDVFNSKIQTEKIFFTSTVENKPSTSANAIVKQYLTNTEAKENAGQRLSVDGNLQFSKDIEVLKAMNFHQRLQIFEKHKIILLPIKEQQLMDLKSCALVSNPGNVSGNRGETPNPDGENTECRTVINRPTVAKEFAANDLPQETKETPQAKRSNGRNARRRRNRRKYKKFNANPSEPQK